MSFDSLAPFYCTLETIVFGNTLQRARTAFIDDLRGCRRALIAGEGDGRFVRTLLARNSEVEITCIDASAKMIELARRRSGGSRRVEFIQRAILDTQLERHDAIVTNFFLDCFDERDLLLVVDKLAAAATDDAVWLVAEFTDARRGTPLIPLMYAFFRAATRISGSRLIDYSPLLAQHRFRRSGERTFFGGIVRAEVWRRD